MLSRLREEKGVTLLEAVVVVIIVGIALPSLFVLMGNLSVRTVTNRLMTQSVYLADSRLEEIQAFRDANWDWYQTVEERFEGTEEQENGFSRQTRITYIAEWGEDNQEAYEVTVVVSNSNMPRPFQITFYLTKFTY